MIRLWLVAALALPWAVAASAQDWGAFASVSSTMGVEANRLCLGEGSRGDIGCPSFAPYVNTAGLVGVGSGAPLSTLDVLGNLSVTAGVSSSVLAVRQGQSALLFDGNDLQAVAGTSASVSVLHLNRLGGSVALGTTNPSTTLHVSGTIRIANGGETCDTNRAGAIRYVSSNFQVCYGSGGWANLADTSSTVATADRITSGTAAVIANGNSNSISITESGVTTGYYYNGMWVAGGVSTTGTISATGLYVTNTAMIAGNVGIGRTFSGNVTPTSELQVSSSRTTGVAPFLYVQAGKANSNGTSGLFQRTTSSQQSLLGFSTGSTSPADGSIGTIPNKTNAIYIMTGNGSGNYPSMVIDNAGGFKVGTQSNLEADNPAASISAAGQGFFAGKVGVGTSLTTTPTPNTALEVSGTLKIANSGEACDANRTGAIRYVNSNFQVCYGTGGWANLADTSSTVATADRITSGTAAVIANGNSNSISITESGVTTGYYYNGIWVAGGVSTTGIISATRYIASSNDSASAPGYTWSGDTNTGLFRPAADTVGFSTGGSEALRITSLGRVGIGLAAPTAALHISATSTATLRLERAGSNIFSFGIGSDSTNGFSGLSVIPVSSTGDFAWQTLNADYLMVLRSTQSAAYIPGANKLAIGISPTMAPSTSLHVSGTIRIANGGETCDANRAGAIRYVSSNFQVCYGTGGWANLADASSTVATADRITSGTAAVIANGNSNSISITESGVTTGYYYNGIWVAGGVSTTGRISATSGYYSGNVSIRGTLDIVTGTGVVSIGQSAATANAGNYVTAIGNLTGQNSSGLGATLVGGSAGQNNSGSSVVAIGYAAGMNNAANVLVAAGAYAAQNNTGTYTTALGYFTGNQNTGGYLTAVGGQTATYNTGNYLTVVGFQSSQFGL